MHEVFVLTLGDGTDPRRRNFAGSFEHVDTGRERRFRSTDELLSFLADCLQQERSDLIDGEGDEQ
jgi:hypothetical protein